MVEEADGGTPDARWGDMWLRGDSARAHDECICSKVQLDVQVLLNVSLRRCLIRLVERRNDTSRNICTIFLR